MSDIRRWDEAVAALAGGQLEATSALLEAPLHALLASRADEDALAALGAERLVRVGEAALALWLDRGPSDALRRVLHDLLEHGHRRAFLRTLYAQDRGRGPLARRWMDVVARTIEATPFTLRTLLERRAARYPEHVLFRVLRAGGEDTYTYAEVAALVARYGAALHRLRAELGTTGPVALLSKNRIEMALVDLACLTSGIVDVMIPTTSSPGHVRTILAHSESGLFLASSPADARKAHPPDALAEHLAAYVLFDPTVEMRGPEVRYLPDVLALADAEGERAARAAGEATRARDLATIMYTSGTTGQPKGIPFHHLNIVSKRFARAIALPELGEGERFLCYLPLCHTFGRWLEMTGALFWAGTYTFLENPTLGALLDGMERVKPTVFISVPSKWVELYEHVTATVDPSKDAPEVVRAALERATGGALRRGLSAAGRLEPDIFRFFQGNAIELHSGYGMTEATGGISMTPPGECPPDSVGIPLPGIEARLAPDGELVLRGPYVIESYYKPLPDDDVIEDGWLHTGDLFDEDTAGHLFFRDRKKEVYKNSKGQTVAPRLIEKHLEDFDEVQACFLVGDGKPYNTALIYPNYELPNVPLADWTSEERHEYFRSLIVSVNRFLDPFERIVNFALIERDFERERGERTLKGSLRRKEVERSFTREIESLYAKDHVVVAAGDVPVRLPIWLLRELGVTAGAVLASPGGIELADSRRFLPIAADPEHPGRFQVGSLWYDTPGRDVDLDLFLRAPRLWVGNLDLVGFAGDGIFDWALRPKSQAERVTPVGWATPTMVLPDLAKRLHDAVERAELTYRSVHVAFAAILMQDERLQGFAVRFLGTVLREGHSGAFVVARDRLLSASAHSEADIRRLAFMCLGTSREETGFRAIIESYWGRLAELLDEDMVELLCQVGVGTTEIESLLGFLRLLRDDGDRRRGGSEGAAELAALFRFLARYGAYHAEELRAIRYELAGWALDDAVDPLGTTAYHAVTDMTERFRRRLARPDERASAAAVLGYGWGDVLVFEEGLGPGDRERIRGAFERTPLLAEAFALLYDGEGAPRGLEDLAPGSIWVTFRDLRNGRTHYRVAVRTRTGTRFAFTITLYSSHLRDTIETETLWLVRLGRGPETSELVDDVGGLYSEFALWTTAESRGETVRDLLHRVLYGGDPKLREQAREFWPYVAWSALAAYVEYWARMGRRWIVAGPGPGKVIVPPHDYLRDARIVSTAGRRRVSSLGELLVTLDREFLESVRFHHPEIAGAEDPDVVFLAVLEVLGREEGLDALQGLLADGESVSGALGARIEAFLDRIETEDFAPKPLVFAVRRYHRWLALTPDATPVARATMLRQLWDAYGLEALRRRYPELRVRFFRQTVLADAEAELARALDRLAGEQRKAGLATEDLLGRIARLQERAPAGSSQEFYLARMAYPYLTETAPATLVTHQAGSLVQADLVVTLADADGRLVKIRHAATPREVGKLRRLFLEAKMHLHFLPEYQYMVVLDERDYVIGGLLYAEESASEARVERYVVAAHRRGKGIARLLVDEFCNRMTGRGLALVTMPFMQPRYHQTLGFVVDHQHGGLMRHLTPDSPSVPGFAYDPGPPPASAAPSRSST